MQDHYEDMIKIMVGEIDEDGYVTKGHISNQQDLLNRERNHNAKSLTSNQVHYLRMTQTSVGAVSRLRHPLRRKKKLDEDVQSEDSGTEASSPRTEYRDVGMGSTLLGRQAAAATTIQHFRRVKTGTTALASDPVAPRSSLAPTEKRRGEADKQKGKRQQRRGKQSETITLADMSDRPPSFDLEIPVSPSPQTLLDTQKASFDVEDQEDAKTRTAFQNPLTSD